MVSRLFSLKRSVLLTFTVLAGAPLVQAQTPTNNGWKPIIFSSPDNNVVSSNVASLSTQPVPPANLQGGLFENTTPIPSFSFGAAPTMDTRPRQQKKSDDRSDWVFQTPAEIMGLAQDQMLEPNGKRNNDSQQKKLTPLERYLEGRSPTSKSRMHSSPSSNYGEGENAQTNDDNYSPDLMNNSVDDLQSSAAPGQPLNAMPSTVVGNGVFANPNQDAMWPSAWGTSSAHPTLNPVNTQQQQADIDQFRHMLNPSFVPATPAATGPDNVSSFKSQISLPASSSTQPLINPIGASFAPLSSGIGQPSPIAQLPGITSQAVTQPSLTPSWAPQPAPWTSPNPQPFTIPQRKF